MIAKEQLNHRFEVTDELIDRCMVFAKASIDSSNDKYSSRGQDSTEKKILDIRNGRIGEETAYNLFSTCLPNLSKPDYNIYGVKQKSWVPDLVDPSGIELAVKTQDIFGLCGFGESWTFQWGHGVDCDGFIFKEKDLNHYVTFVQLNTLGKFAAVRGIVKVQWLHDNDMFKDPVKESLWDIKLVVYYTDLEKHKDELWQL